MYRVKIKLMRFDCWIQLSYHILIVNIKRFTGLNFHRFPMSIYLYIELYCLAKYFKCKAP